MKQQGEKQITCYQCGSDKVTATISMTTEKPPRPIVHFHCAMCLDKQLGIPNPICGLAITRASLTFLFGAEDIAQEKINELEAQS